MLETESEFRLNSILKHLLHKHEHWDKIDIIITYGINYRLTEISEEIRKEDLAHTIERGNHKSAECKENATTPLKNYTIEVEHG